ncbi:hypothetical protein CkaCkLH20_03591 [Colletotrichum karsti]|uniref:Enoyl reductase (ER) domain-containing protein n=1 Tax=Colletotrichum karsti TaxID=1095194 RepID=A0A9P6IDS3_9PEZI|nr:uncharacterized protein CkaCkLH20_03591 [Colletotrichum karsti]KAF9878691.1 hypothetical protein CkaCkLH20_03591 [Colletotrichum karsti]
MRLINTNTLALEEFFGNSIPPYAILSHTWGSEEVTFQDWKTLAIAREKRGFQKIELARSQAISQGLEYLWVDTNCINKESSTELAEAINSMYTWYRNAEVCYAYLSDVSEAEDPDKAASKEALASRLSQSQWFTRGWTLQELLAPRQVLFFSREWRQVGTRKALVDLISKITGISTAYMSYKKKRRLAPISSASVAERMSWLSCRRTSRIEDMAYCMLGIFDISMPLLYGEGSRAFTRLQEEILKVSTDESLFCWSWNENDPPCWPSMLAPYPKNFRNAMPRSIDLGADGKLSISEVSEEYQPKNGQALISVKYSGVNHCDLNFFHVGLHSFVTGFEFAGIVEATGHVSTLKVGDAVFGLSPVHFPKPSSFGTHQDKAIVEDSLTYKIPDGLGLKEAAGVAMGAQTATDAIFNVLGFGLPAAGVTGTKPENTPILIWGGASSVGVSAIQLANIAGFNPIFVTASSKNHATLEALGASHCFDYKSPTITDEIRSVTKELGIVLSVGFDTVGSGLIPPGQDVDKSSPSLMRKSLSEDADVEDIKLVCTLPVPHDGAFGFCTSYRPAGAVGAIGEPQNPEFPQRTRKVMDYATSGSGKIPKHPNVVLAKGGELGITEIQRIAYGGASMEKVVIEHPI